MQMRKNVILRELRKVMGRASLSVGSKMGKNGRELRYTRGSIAKWLTVVKRKASVDGFAFKFGANCIYNGAFCMAELRLLFYLRTRL
jgi:hypothetical protein